MTQKEQQEAFRKFRDRLNLLDRREMLLELDRLQIERQNLSLIRLEAVGRVESAKQVLRGLDTEEDHLSDCVRTIVEELLLRRPE